jgi:ABC-2 type transport system permease protein
MLIGGLMLPSSLLPEAFGKVGLLLPSSHAMNAFKGWALDQTASFDPLWSIIILLTGGILSWGLAIYLFSWDDRNATRRGHPALALVALLPYAIAAALLP